VNVFNTKIYWRNITEGNEENVFYTKDWMWRVSRRERERERERENHGDILFYVQHVFKRWLQTFYFKIYFHYAFLCLLK